jgi:hypothetical protein
MPQNPFFPPLPEDLESTRATLHAYALGVAAIPRAHALPHPKWWHVSLRVRPDGLATENIGLPQGGSAYLRMDLHRHEVVLLNSEGVTQTFSMTEGLTGSGFGERLIAAAAELGLDGEYAREKFENTDPREYDPEAASAFFSVLAKIERLFERHRADLPGDTGPVQLWPHGFDLAFEWFGTRVEKYEENGEVTEYPSQLNLGFYAAGPRPYFYSNPWPFEKDRLLDQPLPSGGEWFTEAWEGSILYYDQLQDDPEAADKLLAYAKAVFEIASPTLTE